MRILLGNATLMSVVYLGAAVVVEAVRRFCNARWSERASLAIESLPGRALEVTGLLAPLRRSFVYGQLSPTEVRLVFGATAVVLIFAMALGVGLVMWGVRLAWERRTGLD